MERKTAEDWKDIQGYEDSFMISSDGVVVNKITGKTLNGYISKLRGLPGYRKVDLWVQKKRKCIPVHRILAIAFIPNPNNYSCVNHKDGNKLNNSLENLEWCSPGQNLQHAYDIGLRKSGEELKLSKLKNSDIPEIRQLLASGMTHRAIAKLYGVSSNVITKINTNRLYKRTLPAIHKQ